MKERKVPQNRSHLTYKLHSCFKPQSNGSGTKILNQSLTKKYNPKYKHFIITRITDLCDTSICICNTHQFFFILGSSIYITKHVFLKVYNILRNVINIK